MTDFSICVPGLGSYPKPGPGLWDKGFCFLSSFLFFSFLFLSFLLSPPLLLSLSFYCLGDRLMFPICQCLFPKPSNGDCQPFQRWNPKQSSRSSCDWMFLRKKKPQIGPGIGNCIADRGFSSLAQ